MCSLAVDKLRELGYEVVASSSEEGAVTITVKFGLAVDLSSGTVNGKDVMASLTALRAQIKELKHEA